MISLTFFLGLACFCAAGSVEPSTAAISVATQTLSVEELAKIRSEAPAVALALDLALGATIWAEVKISTMGPVYELTRLSRQGYYKLELIQIVLLSAQGKTTLKKTLEKRKKGATLADIAKDYMLDYDELYEAALAIEEIVDRQYLPRLTEKRLRRDDEER